MTVSEVETLHAEIRVLSARATNMKMNLHDLAEELPINWQTIMTVAQQTQDAFKAFEAARAKLKEAKAKAA
jgi:hypothetical protein